MPRCIIDSSRGIERHARLENILEVVHDAAAATILFCKGDVKVRINLFDHFTVVGTGDAFLQTIACIMVGRTEKQRQDLTRRIAVALKDLLPQVRAISMDVLEINRAAYNNRNAV